MFDSEKFNTAFLPGSKAFKVCRTYGILLYFAT